MKFFSLIVYFGLLCQYSLSARAPIVLVIGGAGYIGSHTCKTLDKAGFTPVVFDSLSKGSRDAVRWGPLFVGNVNNLDDLDQAFLKYKPDAVIHFAGLCNVGESVIDPSSYYYTNVSGSINILKTMIKHNVDKLIFSSSCTVYGNVDGLIDETADLKPINPYARSKLMAEKIIEDCSKAYKLSYIILRYFNAAGMDTDARLKRSPLSFNFLIPKALNSILNNKESLGIYGTDYSTPDGTAIRDYIHVKDLAEAHALALKCIFQQKGDFAINLGTGKGHSVAEVIKMIEKVTKQVVPFSAEGRREGDVEVAVANPQKAKKVIGFSSKYTLREMIESEWDSMSD